MQKLLITSDKNLKSLNIKIKLKKLFKNKKINISNLVFVIGGDGFMLETLKKNKNFKKNFYGINSGNYGFLMNKFSITSIILATPITLGIISLCIRVSMLTGANG